MLFNLTISENASNSTVVPQTILFPIFSICIFLFYLLSIACNTYSSCFPNFKFFVFIIWWWLSVEYKLVQNIEHIILIIFASNNFEFPCDILDSNQHLHQLLILLQFHRIRKFFVSSKLLKLLGSIWSFRSLELGIMTSSDYNILPFISLIILCLEKAIDKK